MQRRWHFLLADPLTPEQQRDLIQALSESLQDWRAHGRPITWNAKVWYDQILEITATSPVSGCATDELFRTVKAIIAAQKLTLLPTDHLLVLSEGKSFTKKFHEIIEMHRVGTWVPSWRIVEMRSDGLEALPVERSMLAIHLS